MLYSLYICPCFYILYTDPSFFYFVGASGQDPKGKGKVPEESLSKPSYCSEGKHILKDQQENLHLHSTTERELLSHEQLRGRTVLLYRILFNIMLWLDKRLTTMAKPCFIHGKHIRFEDES